MRQRKFQTNYTISKKELFIQVSHKTYVVLVNKYFDEEKIIILRCINSLHEKYFVISSGKYTDKSQSIETTRIHASEKEILPKKRNITLMKTINTIFCFLICFFVYSVLLLLSCWN